MAAVQPGPRGSPLQIKAAAVLEGGNAIADELAGEVFRVTFTVETGEDGVEVTIEHRAERVRTLESSDRRI